MGEGGGCKLSKRNLREKEKNKVNLEMTPGEARGGGRREVGGGYNKRRTIKVGKFQESESLTSQEEEETLNMKQQQKNKFVM